MSRLPDAVIQTIKAEVSLLRLAQSQGYQLQQQGKDYALCCPFHDDKEPSCIITPKSNLFNCFGCGTGGSVIDWVMKTQGVSFRHAVEILRDGNPSFTQNTRAARGAGSAADSVVKKTTVPKLEAPISEASDNQTVLREVIDYYHQTLKQSPEALEYLEKRGLNDPELIDYFKLGYANRTLGLRLPHKNRKSGAALREQLQAVGIYRDTGREHFNGSLVIPVINNNTIKEIYGRKLLNNLRVGTPKHTYLPGPHAGIFNLEGLRNTKEVILCESLIDALTFWRWGFKHVTSSYGVNGFTEELQQALIDNNVKRVLIAYDRDEAGNKAAENVASQLTQHGIDCFRVLFPKGMDANAYARDVMPGHKSLGVVIRSAQWMGSGEAPRREQATGNRQQEKTEPNKAKERFEAELKTLAKQVNTISEKAPSPQAQSVDVAATPMPAMPATDIEVKQNNNELFIELGDRTYRVRGLDKNTEGDQLKIQLLVKKGETFHMDKLDLYSSKQRQVFINQACVELGVKDEVIKKDLGKVLLALEEHQAKQCEDKPDKQTKELEPEARKAALSLLTDPDLLTRILADFSQAGVVGEETNKLAGYLSCVSRKLEKPLAVIIQSSSAAGKSSLMESILALMPEEERVQYSAMTGQSLFYMGETNLKNKILAISEEEGASNASYALKLLQSEGEVTIASTGKDDSTGNLVTKEYTVQGPVMLFLTTTAIDIDEELLNRCVVLTVNESREQTQAIHQAQRARRTLQGLHSQAEKKRIIQLHRDAQRLLKPLYVINPYADRLSFRDDLTRTRRDHEKYLTLIDSIALLHQYQRDIKTVNHNGEVIEYIEVTLDDIAVANRLAHEILGRTLDELPPQTRKLLKEIQTYVQHECQQQNIAQRDFRFSRKHIREVSGWSDGQLKIHCKRLEEMEYLLVHRGGRGQSMEYELLYSGDMNSDKAQFMGLLDVDKLTYDGEKSGQNPQKSAPSQGQVRPKSDLKKSLEPTPAVAYSDKSQTYVENALRAV